MLNTVRSGHETIIKKTQVCVICMLGDFSEKRLEILISVKLVHLGCFNEAVEYGTGFCAVTGFDQDEILPPYGERMDPLFSIVVIERYVTIIQELLEVRFLVDAVGEGYADGAVASDLFVLCFYPRKVGISFIS